MNKYRERPTYLTKMMSVDGPPILISTEAIASEISNENKNLQDTVFSHHCQSDPLHIHGDTILANGHCQGVQF